MARRNHDALLAGAKTGAPVGRAAHPKAVGTVLVGRGRLHAWPGVHGGYATGSPIPGSTHLPRGASVS